MAFSAGPRRAAEEQRILARIPLRHSLTGRGCGMSRDLCHAGDGVAEIMHLEHSWMGVAREMPELVRRM